MSRKMLISCALLTLCSTGTTAGAYDKAYLDHAVELFSKKIAANPKDAETYFARGAVYKELGEFQKALQDLNKAIQINSKNMLYWEERGAIKGSLKDFAGEVKDLTSGIALPSTVGQAGLYTQRAGAYVAMQDFSHGLADCDKAISLNPKADKALVLRAICHMKAGKKTEALADLKKATAVNPKNEDIETVRGLLR